MIDDRPVRPVRSAERLGSARVRPTRPYSAGGVPALLAARTVLIGWRWLLAMPCWAIPESRRRRSARATASPICCNPLRRSATTARHDWQPSRRMSQPSRHGSPPSQRKPVPKAELISLRSRCLRGRLLHAGSHHAMKRSSRSLRFRQSGITFSRRSKNGAR